jgi:Ca-activated chloride channel family protein
MANDNTVLARVPLVVEKAEAQVEAPASANVAAEFEVKWQGPNTKGDYISIALPADDGGNYKAYTYTKSGNPLKLKAPSDPGQYEVRYILGQGNKILAKTPISIQAVTASVQPPASAPAGSSFEVSWQGPATDGDYISIALPGSAPGSYKGYTYTDTGNPLKLKAPSDPGNYEVRYILGQGNKLLAKASITVTAVSATVSAPAEVAAKSKFEASWTGPGYEGDYVTIVEANAKDDQYKSYFYVNTGASGELTAPDKPGAYEVRYVMDQGRKVIGRSKITVK